MLLFEEILNEMCLLTEDASINDVNNAIKNMHPVMIKYDDKNGGLGKNKRYICPIAYGISTAGNPVIRAFQTVGSSKKGTPKWKLFRLDRITSWRTINSKTFNPEDLKGLNKDGDAQIETLYTIAPIGIAKNIANQQSDFKIKSTPITKNDVKNINVEPEEKADDNNFTADNAINSIITNLKSKNSENNVDNKEDNKYNTNKTTSNDNLEAPETEPIHKGDINGVTDKKEEPNKNDSEETEVDDNPIMKKDLENNEVEDVKNNFKDLMNRMDNLNNNEEEEKEEEEDAD